MYAGNLNAKCRVHHDILLILYLTVLFMKLVILYQTGYQEKS